MPPKKGQVEERLPLLGRLGTNLKVIANVDDNNSKGLLLGWNFGFAKCRKEYILQRSDEVGSTGGKLPVLHH